MVDVDGGVVAVVAVLSVEIGVVGTTVGRGMTSVEESVAEKLSLSVGVGRTSDDV